MSYRVEAYWQGHSESEHDDIVGAMNAARVLVDDHEGAAATVTGPGVIANVVPITSEVPE